MTATLTRLLDVARSVTSAQVEIESLGGDEIHVAIFWPETQGDDGDHCHGQNTIIGEACRVMKALEGEGFEHCEFGGRKNMGHSGGTTGFAMKIADPA